MSILDKSPLTDYYKTLAKMLRWSDGFLWGEESAIYNSYIIYRKKKKRAIFPSDPYNYTYFGHGVDTILGRYTLPEVLEYLDNRENDEALL